MGDIYLEFYRGYQVHPRLDSTRSRQGIWRLNPKSPVSLELADGTFKKYPYGFCLFDFSGERVSANVVIGPKNSEPIVGTHVLQDFRLVIDMEKHTVSCSRSMPAKTA